jgi:hypothetical protein
MGIFDKFRSPGFDPGSGSGFPRSSPLYNGSCGNSPLSLDEARELRELRAQRDRLLGEERRAEERLLALRGQLDDVQNELLAGARSADEKSRIRNVVSVIGQSLPRMAKAGDCTDAFIPGIVRAYVYPQSPPAPPLRQGPPQPAPASVAAIDPVAQAADIVRAGRAAASPDGVQRPFLRGPVQPRQGVVDDEALAAAIVKQGRRVRDGER